MNVPRQKIQNSINSVKKAYPVFRDNSLTANGYEVEELNLKRDYYSWEEYQTEKNKPYIKLFLNKTALKHTRYALVTFVGAYIPPKVQEDIVRLQKLYKVGLNHELKTGKTNGYADEICIKRKGFRTIPIYYHACTHLELITTLISHIHVQHEIEHIIHSLASAL